MAHSLDHETYKQQVRSVWVATVWLSVITVVEVVAALLWLYVIDPEGKMSKLLLNGFFIVASLLKAYFIVGEFMHVRYERRALALTILVPLVFLIWFLIAFVWEGAEWQNNRKVWNALPDIPAAHQHHDAGHGGDHGHDGGKH